MEKKPAGVHVARITRNYKGKSYETYLLRRSYRENGKVKHETLGNLTKLPKGSIDLLRASLKGEVFARAQDAFEIARSYPHGHLAAALSMAKKLGVGDLIGHAPAKTKKILLALIASRVVNPASKLSTLSWWATTSLALDLGQEVDTDAIYEALDFLLARQESIEKKLAKKHLEPGGLVLYDLSSIYVEGHSCPLAAFGYARDRKKGKKQISFGLVTDRGGRPIATEVFSGDMVDAKTLGSTVEKMKERLGVKEAVVIGDRGMITRSGADKLKGEDLHFITSLRSHEIRSLVESGSLQLSLFDEVNLAEITHPDYPGERLVVCRNPAVAEDRKRTRAELIEAAEKELDKVVGMVERGRLKGKDAIGVRVGKVIDRFKVQKHFILSIDEKRFSYSLDEKKIAGESALDGIYAIRTSVGKDKLDAGEVVSSYKSLSAVERAFRSMKTVDLKVRPIYHRLEDGVKAHVFLSMLSYYVAWHLKEALKPLTFADEEPPVRTNPVAKAASSRSGRRKAAHKVSDDGYPVMSFRCLQGELATLTRNVVTVAGCTFEMLSTPTPLQKRIFELIDAPIPLSLL